MKVFDPQGIEFEAPYDPQILAFIHDDAEVRNPMRSECGRFSIDPRVEYGFKNHMVDEVCVAWTRELPGAGTIFLINRDGGCPLLLGDDEHVVIARYDGSGKLLASSALSEIPWAE